MNNEILLKILIDIYVFISEAGSSILYQMYSQNNPSNELYVAA